MQYAHERIACAEEALRLLERIESDDPTVFTRNTDLKNGRYDEATATLRAAMRDIGDQMA